MVGLSYTYHSSGLGKPYVESGEYRKISRDLHAKPAKLGCTEAFGNGIEFNNAKASTTIGNAV